MTVLDWLGDTMLNIREFSDGFHIRITDPGNGHFRFILVDDSENVLGRLDITADEAEHMAEVILNNLQTVREAANRCTQD